MVADVPLYIAGFAGRRERFARGLREFELHFAWLGQIRAIGHDLSVEAETFVLIEQPLGDAVAGLGSGHVRFAGKKTAEVGFGAGGVRDRKEFLFKLVFGCGTCGSESADTSANLPGA